MNEAAAELDSVRQIASEHTEGWPSVVMQIATHALMGDIAYRQEEFADAVQHYQVAAELQDGLRYTEPAYWNKPVRHDLGAALLAAGQAAERLCISVRTVETHRSNIQHKLGVSSRSDLVLYALENGLISLQRSLNRSVMSRWRPDGGTRTRTR